jgi:hypothetical protein
MFTGVRMQLVKANVTNYRSVEDSEEFTVEPDATCLVGKRISTSRHG